MVSPLLYEETLPWPTEWTAVFQRDAPLLLEIGFGSGHFLVDLAQKRPSANVLGVEIAIPSLRRAARKVQHAGLRNVRLLQSNAWYLLWALVAPHTVHETYINFPDPWPKSGHHHRRLIGERFLHLLATRMIPGGALEIATDHADYAAAITAALLATPYFSSRLPTPFVTEDLTRLRTKYERTAIAAGRTCHYYKWQRNETPAPDIFPVPQEVSMPHVVIQSPLSLAQIAARFQPLEAAQNGRDDDHRNGRSISLLAAYLATDGERLLFETYVKEEPLAQRIGLEMRRRPTGDFVVSLHQIGFPRVTAGVHHAVARLAAWVQSLHPQTQIAHHNLPQDVWDAVTETNHE